MTILPGITAVRLRRSWTTIRCLLLVGLCSGQVLLSGPAALPARAAEPAKLNPNHSSAAEAPLTYPQTHKSDHVDRYHGTAVPDPYRWLEDTDSPETRAWIEAQNRLTFGYLGKISPREGIKQRLTRLWNYERYGVPIQRGGRYFYTRNDGLQNQSVLYTAESIDAEPRELLDPNKLSKDGTVALTGYEISDDGRLLAYGLAAAGSDWQEWRVRDVASAHDLDDHLRWIKFSGASWTPDNAGFFYSRYDEPTEAEKLTGTNYYQKLYYHRLGTPQSEDQLVYQRKDEKEWGFRGEVTEDGHYLIISVWRGTERKNQIFFADLRSAGWPVVELITGFDADYTFIGNDGSTLWFKTDLEAPRYRVLAVNLDQPQREHWREVIPEDEMVLDDVTVVGDRFLAVYLKDAHSQVKVFGLDGSLASELELPGIGTAVGFQGRRSDRETFYAFTGYTNPLTIFRYDLQTGKSSVFRQPKVDFQPEDYETRQVFYRSKDGTRVPMFITHKKGLELDGDNPTLLYGYGGFNASITPSFSIGNLVWMEMGGVYAVANLRGGGEYGRSWHEAGQKQHKQNVFDDFIAAAEWLIENRYTSPQRLAISGRSNGGLLVGACLTQRPDLFAAALPGVGVMDMLRFHKFTIGWAWVSEYGSSDDPEAFQTLLRYSPLHNIKSGLSYPATLVTTADHDDRVVPGHSFKFAAALQAAQAGEAPVLIRIETSAGHGAGTPTAKLIEEVTDNLSFLVKSLKVEVPAAE